MRRTTVALLAAPLLVLPMLTGTASADIVTFSDPVGDADDPIADISSITVDADPTRVVFLTAFAAANNQGLSHITDIDTNNDGETDFEVFDSGNVYDPDFNEVCQATIARPGGGLSITVPSGCLGNPASVRVSQWVATGEAGSDRVPGVDTFTSAVATTPASEAPAPPPVVQPPATPPPSGSVRSTGRLAGPDRYATAVAISRNVFPSGAPIVFLARADSFADALAGGTLSRGPILLVPSCGTVPSVVLDEVRRLGASEVVALGGGSAVCDSVLMQVANA